MLNGLPKKLMISELIPGDQFRWAEHNSDTYVRIARAREPAPAGSFAVRHFDSGQEWFISEGEVDIVGMLCPDPIVVEELCVVSQTT